MLEFVGYGGIVVCSQCYGTDLSNVDSSTAAGRIYYMSYFPLEQHIRDVLHSSDVAY
jgi:hypothetical protein